MSRGGNLQYFTACAYKSLVLVAIGIKALRRLFRLHLLAALSARLGTGKGGLRFAPEELLGEALKVSTMRNCLGKLNEVLTPMERSSYEWTALWIVFNMNHII